MSDEILAIDLGGTRYRAGLASLGDPSAVRAFGEWPAPPDRASFMVMLEGQLKDSGAKHLGLGIPGLVRGTTCSWVPNLPYLDGIDLGRQFPAIHMALGNDAQFALVAEAGAGAALGMTDAILLAVGTGIGSAVLAGGQIIAGSAGAACSFGWAVADVRDPGDERSGWLERQASGRALDQAAAGIGVRDGAALVTAARSGDLAAIAAIDLPMRSLGTALAGAVALLDPEAIILAGGLAEALDVLAPPILAALRRHVPLHLRKISLRPGKFGARAGLVGAALAASRGPEWRRPSG